MMRLLSRNDQLQRTLTLPPAQKDPQPKVSPSPRALPVPQKNDNRAKGRKKRLRLPLGVILWDETDIYEGPEEEDLIAYVMKTGDFAKVYEDEPATGRLRIHPGVDLYLALTSRKVEIAGNQLPDADGWVEKKNIHVFAPDQAVAFTQGTEPITLGKDPRFSTIAFYERAFKNPDPVTHRVIAPRLIHLLSLHEDYSTAWKNLYRDKDSKIRSVTLASLHERGIGNSREMVEDLLSRLVELTRTRAQGEREVEVISIINIFSESEHPRALSGLESLLESWQGNQNENILSTLRAALSTLREALLTSTPEE